MDEDDFMGARLGPEGDNLIYYKFISILESLIVF